MCIQQENENKLTEQENHARCVESKCMSGKQDYGRHSNMYQIDG